VDPQAVIRELRRNRTIDITTTGRKTGQARRIEIWAWPDGDRLYLTGSPGRRDWYANLRANRAFTLHLKRGIEADVPARALPIEDQDRAAADFRAPPARSGRRVDGGLAARRGRLLVGWPR
jgi:deazaflavin-dependent oxidoreductase (nitroreductase family)